MSKRLSYMARLEEIWMEQPKGFEDPDSPDMVWILVKGLYGLKQGGRTFNKLLHSVLTTFGFTRL
jgi:Reverse transcriptase (RNA-dependent DNA polymerase)